MTSGKWLSVLLRLFQWLARRAISLSYLDSRLQRADWTRAIRSVQAVWSEEQPAAVHAAVQCSQCPVWVD